MLSTMTPVGSRFQSFFGGGLADGIEQPSRTLTSQRFRFLIAGPGGLLPEAHVRFSVEKSGDSAELELTTSLPVTVAATPDERKRQELPASLTPHSGILLTWSEQAPDRVVTTVGVAVNRLDIVWLDESRRVVEVLRDIPRGRRQIRPPETSWGVLFLPGGTASLSWQGAEASFISLEGAVAPNPAPTTEVQPAPQVPALPTRPSLAEANPGGWQRSHSQAFGSSMEDVLALRGKLGRADFVVWVIANWVIGTLGYLVTASAMSAASDTDNQALIAVVGLLGTFALTVWIGLSAGAARLRHLEASLGWLVMAFIPVVNLVFMLILAFAPGKETPAQG